jgi:DNA-binding SARP family transcriptional activator
LTTKYEGGGSRVDDPAGLPADRQHQWASPDLLGSDELFHGFPYGLVAVDGDGLVTDINRRATELLPVEPTSRERAKSSCCELICGLVGDQVDGVEGVCLTRGARAAGQVLPEVRLDLAHERAVHAVWVTAAPIDATAERVLFHLRPGSPRDRRRRLAPEWDPIEGASGLRIRTLGPAGVERDRRPINGKWLHQRPGELLKYLVCQRGRLVSSELIAESLWPDAGLGALNRLRHYVHALRSILEPDRSRRAPSRFIVARGGGYMLDPESVNADADEFERDVDTGLALFVQGEPAAAASRLEHGLSLYQGEFLSEDPYAEWALDERDRLHELATRGFRVLASLRLHANEVDAAAAPARRSAEMEPFDEDVQRRFMEICLRQGRRTEAMRRYARFRSRAKRAFGEEPGFSLADLSGGPSSPSG